MNYQEITYKEMTFKKKLLQKGSDMLLCDGEEYSIVFLEGEVASYYRNMPITKNEADKILSSAASFDDIIISHKAKEYVEYRKECKAKKDSRE